MCMTSCVENDMPVFNSDDPVDPKEQFHIYLCFGQSNMEGNATPEAMDKKDVDPRFQMLACVNFNNPKRIMGEWYTATPPIVREGTGLGMADYFGEAHHRQCQSRLLEGRVVHRGPEGR